MSYTTATDFLALLRGTSGGARLLEVPGLDYIVAALSRAGLFRLWVAASPPMTNQAQTVWLRPAQPSWSAEGLVLLWNGSTSQFEAATPELWAAVLLGASGSYSFQSVVSGADAVDDETTLLAVQRTAPVSTVLTLPLIGARGGKPLSIADYSGSVTNHVITLNPFEPGATIMRRASFNLYSTADQLAGVTLYPSVDLNGWVIAP